MSNCLPLAKYTDMVTAYLAAYECVYGTTTTWTYTPASGDCIAATDVTNLCKAGEALIAYAVAAGRTCTGTCVSPAKGDCISLAHFSGVTDMLNGIDGDCCADSGDCCSVCEAVLSAQLTGGKFANMEAVWTVESGTYSTLDDACAACNSASVRKFTWNGVTYYAIL